MGIDLRKIARLARLRIADGQLESMTEEMGKIVQMVEKLPEIDTTGSLLEGEDLMCLRADAVTPSSPRGDILQNAPRAEAGCFWVPKTVE